MAIPPPRYTPRKSPSKKDEFGEYAERIKEKLVLAPKWTSAEIFEWICIRGYKGSGRTVERRMKSERDHAPKERFFDQEYAPGVQSQYDFKESLILPFQRGPQLVHLVFGTLPHSDYCAIKGFPQKNYECFMEGMHSFFETISGMTAEVRIDNLSPCVKKILPNGERLYTKAFARAIAHYGFKVSPCNPGKGSDKGDVERQIRATANRFLNYVKVEEVVFRDFDHLNEVLKSFGEALGHKNELLKNEKLNLKPLPRRDENVLCRIEDSLASAFGTVRFGKSIYSVPDEVISVKCRVVGGPMDVKVYRQDTKQLIATHTRVPDGEHSILLAHSLRGLLRKPKAMVNWAHKDLLFPDPIFKRFYKALKSSALVDQNPERDFLKSINLIQHTTLSEIGVGMELVLESNSLNLFEDLRSIILGERRPENVATISIRLEQVPLKPNLLNYDDLMPNLERRVKKETIDSHPG